MGRPRKKPDLLMNVPLRILLTAEQKQMIQQAAEPDGEDMGAWARPILLRAAQDRIAQARGGKRQK